MDEERLIVALEARVRDFEKNMAKAERRGTSTYRGLSRNSKVATTSMERDMIGSSRRINQALASTSTRIGALGKAFVGTAIAAGMAAITRGAAQAVKSLADLDRQAARSGLSVQAFQELKFVGEQNRIEVDAMTDGLKELQLRADEFVVTGKGPAAEAFQRLGYAAGELERRLEDPKDLFLDLIGRMEDFDDAARIRIGDEIFGGSAGERFVELVGRGEGALRATIQAAHDAGAVVDDELIEKAAELDRKFAALQTRVSSFFKEVAVGAADAAEKIATLRVDLDDLFRTPEQAEGILGEGIAGQLENDSDAAKEHERVIGMVRGEYERLGDAVDQQAAAMMQGAGLMRNLGYDVLASEIYDAAQSMLDLSGRLDDGTISADEFESQMVDVTTEAQTALGEIDAIDQSTFAGVISGLGGLITSLGEAAARARELRKELPGAEPDGSTTPRNLEGSGMNPANAYGASAVLPQAVSTSLRPQLPPVDFVLGQSNDVIDTGGARGGSGAGGGRSQNDYEREIASIVRATEMLNLEAQAIAQVASEKFGYGDAVDYARKKAELLYEAQQAGIELTPEMIAQIEQLATEYVAAADGVDAVRDRVEAAQDAQEEFRESVASSFREFITGAADAREAVGQLINRLADMALESAFSGLFGGFFGGALGGGGAGLFGGSIIPGILHSGGVAGRDGYGHGRSVSASAFAGAPRYHNGGVAGLRPNEVPAILERGERVIPKGQSGGEMATQNITFAPQIDARGADVGAVQRLERALAKANAEFESRVVTTMNVAKKRRQFV